MFFQSIKKYTYQVIIILVALLFALLLITILPRENKRAPFVIIEEGQSLSSVSNELFNAGYTNSPDFFKYFFKIFFSSETVKTGTYNLSNSNDIFDLTYRLVYGEHDEKPIKITIKEGTNIFEIADLCEKYLPDFNRDNFFTLVKHKEGFLFPDTYLFLSTDTEKEVFNIMTETFKKRALPLFSEKGILDEEKIKDAITLASIVEEEAFNSRDRKLISGVLQNRLEIGMPLQVDVTFQYINGKNTYELTLADLKDSSPYNTYVHKGLPPGPISNPGLDSISAVLEPTPNDYLYFLSSKSGVMYYAKTFEEHKKNRERYL